MTNLSARQLELRSNPPVALLDGMEWWVDNPHLLAARLRRDRSVMELDRYELAHGLHGAVVRRLRPRRPAWVRQALAVSGVATAILAGLYLASVTLSLLVLIWPILAVMAALYGGIRLCSGHRVTCAGLHCRGCGH